MRAGLGFWSILVGQHDRRAGLALVAGVNLEFERVQALSAGAGDDHFEQAPARKGFYRGHTGHPLCEARDYAKFGASVRV